MVKIKDSARIIAGEAPEGAIPDISPEGIDATARLVWVAVINQIDRSTARRRTLDGRPGFLWSGKVNHVIDLLWPELSGGYHLTPDQRKAIKRAINEYHRLCGSLIFRHRESVWWVSEHWAGLTVSNSTHSSENTQEEEGKMNALEDTSGLSVPYACRDENCPYTSEYPQIRSSHERREHGFWVNKGGEKTAISADPLTDADLQSLIIRVATDAEEPESRYYFWNETRRRDSRVTQTRVFKMLEEMADDPVWDLVAHGTSDYYTYYTLASRVTQKLDDLVSTYRSEDSVIDISTPQPKQAPTSNGLFGDHIGNVRRLLSDLEVLDSMELELNADVQAQLVATTAELEETKEQLAAVVRERDQLKNTLDTIRTQILGKGFGA